MFVFSTFAKKFAEVGAALEDDDDDKDLMRLMSALVSGIACVAMGGVSVVLFFRKDW